MDRTYWQHTDNRDHGKRVMAWHAQDGEDLQFVYALCGIDAHKEDVNTADRIPPAGHFCGHCSRSIAARTDVEA